MIKFKDIVLDFFFGIGIIGVVVKFMNRYFIGIEKDFFYIKEVVKCLNNIRDRSDFIINLDLEIKFLKIFMSFLIFK